MKRSPPVKLAMFGAVLAVAFGGGALAGAAFGSETDTGPPAQDAPHHTDHLVPVTGP